MTVAVTAAVAVNVVWIGWWLIEGLFAEAQARTPPPLEWPRACCAIRRAGADVVDDLHTGKLAQIDARLAGETGKVPRLRSYRERSH